MRCYPRCMHPNPIQIPLIYAGRPTETGALGVLKPDPGALYAELWTVVLRQYVYQQL